MTLLQIVFDHREGRIAAIDKPGSNWMYLTRFDLGETVGAPLEIRARTMEELWQEVERLRDEVNADGRRPNAFYTIMRQEGPERDYNLVQLVRLPEQIPLKQELEPVYS